LLDLGRIGFGRAKIGSEQGPELNLFADYALQQRHGFTCH